MGVYNFVYVRFSRNLSACLIKMLNDDKLFTTQVTFFTSGYSNKSRFYSDMDVLIDKGAVEIVDSFPRTFDLTGRGQKLAGWLKRLADY